MVQRWHLLILLLALPGCETIAEIDRADIIAALAVRYGALSLRNPAPLPDDKTGCDEGCQCAGTGKERSGDGLAIVNCRCDDDCECKPEKLEPQAEPVIKKAAAVDPEPLPLVKIPQETSSTSCTSGNCAPMPAQMPQVMSVGRCADGSCGPQQVSGMVRIPTFMSTGSCANGSCSPQPMQSYRTTRRRLFRR